jgi:hypothetical protein
MRLNWYLTVDPSSQIALNNLSDSSKTALSGVSAWVMFGISYLHGSELSVVYIAVVTLKEVVT